MSYKIICCLLIGFSLSVHFKKVNDQPTMEPISIHPKPLQPATQVFKLEDFMTYEVNLEKGSSVTAQLTKKEGFTWSYSIDAIFELQNIEDLGDVINYTFIATGVGIANIYFDLKDDQTSETVANSSLAITVEDSTIPPPNYFSVSLTNSITYRVYSTWEDFEVLIDNNQVGAKTWKYSSVYNKKIIIFDSANEITDNIFQFKFTTQDKQGEYLLTFKAYDESDSLLEERSLKLFVYLPLAFVYYNKSTTLSSENSVYSFESEYIGETFAVKIKEERSNDNFWAFEPNEQISESVSLLQIYFKQDPESQIKGVGTYEFIFKALSDSESKLIFTYNSPSEDEPLESKSLQLTTKIYVADYGEC